jgi:hypothetical protein
MHLFMAERHTGDTVPENFLGKNKLPKFYGTEL